MKRISSTWMAEIESSILQNKKIDIVSGETIAMKWLIETLAKYGKSFKVYKLGLGVSRVTTETDICPCCLKKL